MSIVKKSQATIPLACARRNCCHVSEARRGAGSMPDRCRIDQIPCRLRSGSRAGRARRGFGDSPNAGSRAPAARSAPADRRRLLACPAADADTSTVARAATDANDESSPDARTRCPTAHAEASGPMRQGTSDRPDDNTAGPPADGAPRARDARPAARPRPRRPSGTAAPPTRGGVEAASRRMR